MHTPIQSGGANASDRGPNVRFPPPLLFVVTFFVGWLAQRMVPLPELFAERAWTSPVGLAVMASGLALTFTGILTFRRARTPVYPNRPARRIVTHGVFRFTRNPMYTGMALLYLGGVVTTRLVWPLLLFPFVVLVLTLTVIRKEERHLREVFADEYGAYSARVRRWL